jgi:DNA-binding transcriptional LysR family regulator
MELRQLQYFIAVAEEANFTRAAKRVSVAQPAVSQQIQRMESQLGEKLFIRDRRTVRLTAAGEALLPHARAALDAADHGREAVRATRGVLTGRLAIGFVSPLPDRRFLHLVGTYRQVYPGIELTLIEDETPELVRRLGTGAIDAALIGLGPYHEPPPKTRTMLVAREPVVVAVSKDHRYATRKTITLRALRAEPMVTLTSNSLLRLTLAAATRTAGFVPNIVAETSDIDLLVQLAEEGVGVALLPQSAVASTPILQIIPLTQPSIDRRLVFVWPETHLSPAGRAFVELAEHAYEPASRARIPEARRPKRLQAAHDPRTLRS